MSSCRIRKRGEWRFPRFYFSWPHKCDCYCKALRVLNLVIISK